MDDKSVAKQRLGKRTSTIGKLFSKRSAPSKSTRKPAARQYSGKNAPTTMGDGVFNGVRANEILKTNGATIQF
jgi:hypothetical protein